MIRTLREMPPSLQADLLRLFSPADAAVADEDLWPRLVHVLKSDVLLVSDSVDLGEALRRRLVEVTVDRLGVLESEETNAMTDIEIAATLTGYLVLVAAEVEENDELKRFFRTKSKRQKLGALKGAQAVTSPGGSSGQVAGDRGEESSVYAEILDALAPGATRGTLSEESQDHPASRWGKVSSLSSAAITVQAIAALSEWKKAGVAAPTVLGSTSGASFMAGLKPVFDWNDRTRQRTMRLSKDGADDRPRSNRARNSRMVQNVATLAAFVVDSVGDPAVAAKAVRSHLQAMGREFEQTGESEFTTDEGSASVTITVSPDGERSVVTLRSPLVSGVAPTPEDLLGLLASNDSLTFAKFAWSPGEKAIYVADELLGDTLDSDELAHALQRVAELADEGDDRLAKHFSGITNGINEEEE